MKKFKPKYKTTLISNLIAACLYWAALYLFYFFRGNPDGYIPASIITFIVVLFQVANLWDDFNEIIIDENGIKISSKNGEATDTKWDQVELIQFYTWKRGRPLLVKIKTVENNEIYISRFRLPKKEQNELIDEIIKYNNALNSQPSAAGTPKSGAY